MYKKYKLITDLNHLYFCEDIGIIGLPGNEKYYQLSILEFRWEKYTYPYHKPDRLGFINLVGKNGILPYYSIGEFSNKVNAITIFNRKKKIMYSIKKYCEMEEKAREANDPFRILTLKNEKSMLIKELLKGPDEESKPKNLEKLSATIVSIGISIPKPTKANYKFKETVSKQNKENKEDKIMSIKETREQMKKQQEAAAEAAAAKAEKEAWEQYLKDAKQNTILDDVKALQDKDVQIVKDAKGKKYGVSGGKYIQKVVMIGGYPCIITGANDEELKEDEERAKKYIAAHGGSMNKMQNDIYLADEIIEAGINIEEEVEINGRKYFIINKIELMDATGKTVASLEGEEYAGCEKLPLKTRKTLLEALMKK